MPVRDREHVRVEDDVFGREADLLDEQVVGAAAIATRWSRRSPARSSSNAITTTAAPYSRTLLAWRRNSASPSLSEIELTTPLPCRHSRPASSTEHFDVSTIIGIRAISGSVAIRFRNLLIAATPSSMPSSMQTSRMFAPPSTCWRATATGSIVLVVS